MLQTFQKKILPSVFLFFLVSLPLFASAESGFHIITCDVCTIEDFFTGIDRLLSWFIVISVSISAVVFSYAGFLYLTSGGDSGKRSKANQIFVKVLLGFIFVLSSWILVKFILVGLGVKDGFKLLRF